MSPQGTKVRANFVRISRLLLLICKMFVIAFEVENKIFLTYHSIWKENLPMGLESKLTDFILLRYSKKKKKKKKKIPFKFTANSSHEILMVLIIELQNQKELLWHCIIYAFQGLLKTKIFTFLPLFELLPGAHKSQLPLSVIARI